MTKTLVAYFSATGTTRAVAERLAHAIGADLAEIQAAEPFTAADLDWTNPNSRSSVEHRDRSMRPALAANAPSVADYDRVFLGYPLWWETAPRVVRTWLESQDWNGKTLTTFATSSSSVRGANGEQLHDSAPAAHWVNGSRLTTHMSEDDLRTWAESIH